MFEGINVTSKSAIGGWIQVDRLDVEWILMNGKIHLRGGGSC